MTEQILSLVYAKTRTGKPIGKILQKEIDGKQTIVLEKVCRQRHLLRVPPAIAYDLSILRQAESFGVELLECREFETKVIYRISFAKFISRSFLVNRGYGPQRGCELINWDASNPFRGAQRATETPRAPELAPMPAIFQLSIFDIPKSRIWVK